MATKKKPKAKHKKSKQRARRATILSQEHKGSPMAGHEERMDQYALRALELKRTGYALGDIAEKMAEEYKLERIPALSTVVAWINRKSDEVAKGIETLQELRWHVRIEQFNQLEKIKGKWLTIALADEMEIQRWKFEEGSLQPFMDENATKEQLEATKQVVGIMKRQAALLGLDIEKELAKTNDTGEGPQTLQALQVWLINQINVAGPHGAAVEAQGEVLELESGIPEIDRIEKTHAMSADSV